MLIFKLDGRHHLITSRKVGSSTLIKGYGLRPIHSKAIYFKLLSPLNPLSVFVLHRNPFERVVSMYSDKTKYLPSLGITDQASQTLLKDKSEFGTMNDILLKMNFQTFVRKLEKIYQLDSHYRPQIQSLSLRIPGLKNRISITPRITHNSIMPVELRYINQLMDNFNIKGDYEQVNSSQNKAIDIEWDPISIEIVRKLYREDFNFFKYSEIPE